MNNQKNFLISWLIFILPILSLVKIELGGELYIHEIMLALCFPVFLFTRKSNGDGASAAALIIIFGLFWLISQAATDLIRDTILSDLLKGWAKIVLFLVSFYSLNRLLKNEQDALLWTAASTISLFVRPFQLFANEMDPLILWKFGVGPAVLLLLTLPSLFSLQKEPNNTGLILKIALTNMAVGCVSFLLNARSFAGLCIFTSIISLAFCQTRGVKLSNKSLIVGAGLALVFANAVAAIYSWGASSGSFGTDAQEKYEMQMSTGGGVLALVLGGRSESLVSTVAIAESPLIGHGSWAKDYKYTELLIQLKSELSDSETKDVMPEASMGLIPSHSFLLGSWVEAGLMGAVFWIVIIVFCLYYVLPRAWSEGGMLGLLVITSMPTLLWNILFSPFGGNVRVDVAALLAIYCLTVAKVNHQKS